MTNHINTPNAYYVSMEPEWKKADDLMGGTIAMRDAGEVYLPKNERESSSKYKARLTRSFLYNVFGNTVSAMAGKPVREPVKMGEDTPDIFLTIAENIDRQGQNLTGFAGVLLEELLSKGIAYILVDYPEAEPGQIISKADEKTLGLQPYFVLIKAQQLIGYKTGALSGSTHLTQVRIRETVTESGEGAFEEIEVDQVRVINSDTFEIWRQDKEKAWYLHDDGVRSVGKVTLVPVYAKRLGFMRGTTPLKALAEKNIEHWQSSSDQRNILHHARVPLLFGRNLSLPTDEAGRPTGEITTGSLILGEDNSDLRYVEIAGAGSIDAGRQDLESLVDQMESLGGQLMMTKAEGIRTATEENIKASKGNSVLHAVIANAEMALEKAFSYANDWINGDSKQVFTVDMFSDFEVMGLDSATIKELMEMVSGKLISYKSFITELNRRNAFGHEIGADDEMEMIESEADRLTAALPAIEPAPNADSQ
jgi:hypothetical protein